jgi:outer membrane usher protein
MGGRGQLAQSRLTYCGLVLLALVAAWTPGLAQAADPWSEAVLEISLSAETPGDMLVVLRGPGGVLYLEEDDFVRLRLHPPANGAHEHGGRRYYAPTSIKGCTVAVDEARQRAVITAPPGAFDKTTISSAERQHPRVTPASPGGFLNYQLSAQQVGGQNIDGAYGEFGAFAGRGVLTNSVVARSGGGEDALIRLDTTYTLNYPEQLETISVGDAISDPASWGDAVRYAGVRWSRNFALRPDLLTTPLLTTGGTATVPSTVDVFVNNQLATSTTLPAGPFVIDRLPTVSGEGNVNVVVRDALGREQVTTQSFYTSGSLLAPGLTQYAVNLGSVRDNYALASDQYGQVLGEASYRRGITAAFTLEGHAEYLAGDAHAAGLNAAIGVGHIGVVNLTAAAGGDAGGSGRLGGVAFEHRDGNFSVTFETLWAGDDFAQVGEAASPAQRMRQRSLLQSGLALGRFGSLSAAYVHETYRGAPEQTTLSLTHSVSFGRSGAMNFTLSRTETGALDASPAQNSLSAYLIYVYPLGKRSTASVTTVAGSGSGAPQNEMIAALADSPPVGPGSGYRLSASTAGNYDADWRQQFTSTDLELEAARNQGVAGRSAYMSGAVTLLDGEVNAMRTVNGSFAVVDLDGIAGVPIYVENQLTARTDESGKALLYNLRPYEANHLSIDPEDLPLDTTIVASSLVVAPPYRSGVIAKFPVERVRGGTFRLIQEDGTPVPVGAKVNLKGMLFPVVLDGVVYVTGFDHGMAADASWPGGHCAFRLPPPPADEPVPDVGTLRCRAAPAKTAATDAVR